MTYTDTILQTLESDTQIWESEVFQNKNIDLIDKNQNISTEKEETVKELPTSTEMFPAQPQTLTTSEDSTTESKEVDHVVEKQADELTQEHALEKLVGEEEKWKNELLAEFGEKFKLKYTFEFKTITEKLYTAQKIDHKSLIYLLFHYIYKLYVVSNMTVKYESIFDYLSVYIKNKDITIWKKKTKFEGFIGYQWNKNKQNFSTNIRSTKYTLNEFRGMKRKLYKRK